MVEPQSTATAGRHYLIHTDGGCRGNPGPGGWGVVIQLKDGETVLRERELSGTEVPTTTNNRMELTAALRALERLVAKDIPVLLRSDSQLLVKGKPQEGRQNENGQKRNRLCARSYSTNQRDKRGSFMPEIRTARSNG